MSDLKTTFGRRVRSARTSAGLTQADVAERIGKSAELIGRIERGQVGPSFETIEALCEVLSVSAAELFGGAARVPSRPDKAIARVVSALSDLHPDELEWCEQLLAHALRRPTR